MKDISVIGVGKLGIGFALLLEKNGFNVCGMDNNYNYVNELQNKTFNSYEPYYNELLQNSKNILFTNDLKKTLDFSNNIFIMVQTPNGGGNKFYDHSILSNLLFNINQYKPNNKNIFIQCTVMPTYIENIAKNILKDCQNCTINYNPEFVAQGSIIQDFKNPDIILVGTDNIEKIQPIITSVYNSFLENKPFFSFMKPTEAEVTKISLNSYITMKITFANQISDLCENLNIESVNILDTMGKDKRIGNEYFKAGDSYGGPCFPRDTLAMKQLLDNYDICSNILNSISEYNHLHTLYQVQTLLKENKDEYVIENVCYKKNSKIPIIEESANMKKALLLLKKNKTVVIKDNLHIINEVKKEYGSLFRYIISE